MVSVDEEDRKKELLESILGKETVDKGLLLFEKVYHFVPFDCFFCGKHVDFPKHMMVRIVRKPYYKIDFTYEMFCSDECLDIVYPDSRS